MKAGKTTWCLAGLMMMAGFSSASCGKDEGLEGKGGTGALVGGEGNDVGGGGKSGNVGRGGDDGEDGGTTNVGGTTGGTSTGGIGTSAPATKLGRACMADADCKDTKAPGLTCVTTSIGDGAPPGGLCTLECDPADQGTTCEAVGAGALCYPFGDKGYCVEACAFGEPGVNEVKCHNRDDFACNPALLGDTMEPCTDTTADCNAGELCVDGTCNVVFPGCLPACRGDIDCAEGTYCDQSFLGGLCLDKKPTGKALGEPCTVPAEDDPAEPDECLGFCQADGADTNEGHCVVNCGLGKECSWSSGIERFEGVCIYPSILDQDGGLGDFGFCMPACNCTADCQDPTLQCTTEAAVLPTATYKGAGLCYPADQATEEYDQCSGTGDGGAGSGGAGSGGADSGGAGG